MAENSRRMFRVVLGMFVCLTVLGGPWSVPNADAQTPAVTCEPWVSHAFNGALADKVDRMRPTVPASSDPCGGQETAYYPVIEYREKPAAAPAEPPANQPAGTGQPAETRPVTTAPPTADEKDVQERALRVRLNEILIVRVQHLQTLLDRAECIDRAKMNADAKKTGSPSAPATLTGCTKREIQLFIDGRPIDGLKPESGAPDVERRSGTLRYHLVRTDGSKEHWADLLGLDLQQGSQIHRDVRISVGLVGGEPIATAVTAFRLVRVRTSWLLVWLLFAVASGAVVYWWATRTDLLRDRNPIVERGQTRPYSLAQCQAAWWTFLTLVSFVFIWLVTGQRDFSGSALTLLGITAGTVLGARLIDATREGPSGDPTDDAQKAAIVTALERKRELETELTTLEVAARSGDQAAATDLASKRQSYRVFIEDLRRTHPGLIAQRSEGFLVDLLSDARGVSFHRFQVVAWAVVLGFMFVTEVMARLAMPELDTNLLALLGISSGTYLGLKIPEHK